MPVSFSSPFVLQVLSSRGRSARTGRYGWESSPRCLPIRPTIATRATVTTCGSGRRLGRSSTDLEEGMTFLRSQDNSSDISLLAGDAERGFLVVGYRLLSATVVVTLHFHRSLRSTIEDTGSGSMVRDISETSTLSQPAPLLFESLSIDGSGAKVLPSSRYDRPGQSLS